MSSGPVQDPRLRQIDILDHGFVRLVDWMGDDAAICQAARVSYGDGTKSVSEDRDLIRYLLRHRHTTPFEMVEFKFHCKMPIFVARQWIRHRTASVNEVSGRYSQLKDEYYVPVPERMQKQSKKNKQGSAEQLPAGDAVGVQVCMEVTADRSFHAYHELLDIYGLSRELARLPVPVSTYTEWYWKMDLHNLFHFLKLRMDEHAQWEIRQYANAIFELIQPVIPVACKAFQDYVLNAVTFSADEMDIILERLHYEGRKDLETLVDSYKTLGKREMTEFKKKIGL